MAEGAPSGDKRAPDLWLLFVIALIVNSLIAALIKSPGYIDAAYYASGAELVARGDWQEPYFWNYAAAPASLPAPAFAYWQPLPSLIGALGILLFPGMAPFDAAQAPYILLGSLLPLIAYAIARRFGGRRHGLLAGFLMIFSGYYVVYWSLPETFTPFALSASLALLYMASGREGGGRMRWLVAGLLAGLAHLSRADGLLVPLVGVGLAFAFRPGIPVRLRLRDVALLLGGYLVVMSPLFIRNLSVFAAPLAPGGINVVFMREYNDLYRYPSSLSLSYFLSQGAGPIIESRLSALGSILRVIVGVQTSVMLLPFVVIAFIRRARREPFFTAGWFALALFLAMTLVFSFVGPHGAWLHSAAALMPFVTALAVLGLEDVIRWVASRLEHWQPDRAHRNFGIAFVVIAFFISLFTFANRLIGLDGSRWGDEVAAYQSVGEALAPIAPPGAMLVMTDDPPGFYRVTGYGGIPLVAGDEIMALQAMRDYGASCLVLWRSVPEEMASLKADGPSSPDLVIVHEDDSFTAYCIEEVTGDS